MTGAVPRGKESQGGEEVSTECRALQAATTVHPTRGRSFHVSARTNTPSAAKKMEELEETVAQEGGRIYQTGSKGRKDRGKEQRLTTRTGAKAIANPEELQVEEDTVQKGGYKTQGVKVWKNLKNCFKRDSQAKDTPDRSKKREERDSYGMPTTGMSVKPGRETIASNISPTPKDKNETHGKEASQKGARSQATREEPQPSGTAVPPPGSRSSPKGNDTKKIGSPGPKRKDTPTAQSRKTEEPHRTKTSPAEDVARASIL